MLFTVYVFLNLYNHQIVSSLHYTIKLRMGVWWLQKNKQMISCNAVGKYGYLLPPYLVFIQRVFFFIYQLNNKNVANKISLQQAIRQIGHIL